MNALSHVHAFTGLDPAVLDRIEAGGRWVEPRDGTRIFAQGDAADAVYAITGGEGRVRIGAVGRGSKSLMVEVFHAGDIFGEVGVLMRGVRSADALTESRVRLLRITATGFLSALDENPMLGRNLSCILATRLSRTFTLLEATTFESLEIRLARQLLYLARRDGRPTALGIRLAGRFRQGDLADLLGATTRSIITILNVWRGNGVIIYDTAQALVTIVQIDKLQALIDDGPGT